MKNIIFKGIVNDYAHDGKGVVKYEEYPIFVKDVLLGEEVEVKIVKWKKKYGFGRVLNVLKASDNRITPPCKFYQQCGGCQLQNMDYTEQLSFKRRKITNAFNKQKISLNDFEIIESKNELLYRNKLSIPLANQDKKIVFGLYQENSNNIIAIDKCLIQDETINNVMKELLIIINKYKPELYNKDKCKGYLRQVIIRSANNQLLLGFVVNKKKYAGELDDIIDDIISICPTIKSVVVNHNTTTGNAILGVDNTLVFGEGFIIDQVLDFKFQISLNSFYQVNHDQMINLYQKAISLAKLDKNDVVLDAYCGVGTISLFIANSVKKVIGVDIVKDAINNAKTNQAINNIKNVSFQCNDVQTYMEQNSNQFNTVIIDPPRKGCSIEFLNSLVNIGVSKIVYIACDPGTQSRDVKHLIDNGYAIKETCAVDMFTQTYHVENIVYLERV